MADDPTAKPKTTEVPLGGSCQTLSELHATWQGAQGAAQAAVGASEAAKQRFTDSAKFFARMKKIDPERVERFDFVKGVVVVQEAPA